MARRDREARETLLIELDLGDKKQLRRRYRTAHETWDGPSDRLTSLGCPSSDGKKLTWKAFQDCLSIAAKGQEGASIFAAELSGPGLDAAGGLLFALLFGTDKAHLRRLLDNVYSDPGKEPIYSGVRARVIVKGEDPDGAALVGLPWMATMWQGHLLVDHGWTFETCLDADRLDPVQLRSPPSMLMIAPHNDETGDALRTREHVLDLQDVWDGVWSGWTKKPVGFQVATTIAEARRMLEVAPAEVVYYFGHGEVENGQAYLCVPADRDKRLLGRDLFTKLPALAQHPPAILLVNACDVGRSGWHSVGQMWGHKVPIVLAHVGPIHASGARDFGLQFWTDVVRRHRDPVIAAHDRASPEFVEKSSRSSSRGFVDLASVVVTAHYGAVTWTRVRGIGGQERLRRALDLDRVKQRAFFRDRFEQTFASDLNAHLAFAYGPEKNEMEHASGQLCDTLRSHTKEDLAINCYALRLTRTHPLDRQAIESAFWTHARIAFRKTKQPSMREALRALAPPRLGSKPVVWLDAGCIPVSTAQEAAVAAEEMEELARFLSDLAVEGEGEVFVSGVFAAEVSGPALAPLRQALEDLEVNPAYRTTVRMTVLDPFGDATRAEAMTHLEENGCPPGIVGDLAKALLRSTGGNYQALVERLDQVKAHSDYPALLRRLQRETTP